MSKLLQPILLLYSLKLYPLFVEHDKLFAVLVVSPDHFEYSCFLYIVLESLIVSKNLFLELNDLVFNSIKEPLKFSPVLIKHLFAFIL